MSELSSKTRPPETAARAIDLSLVIPLFNEEESLGELHRAIGETMARHGARYEILFIDDGSTDRSFDILKAIRSEDPNVRLLKLRRNFGKSAALSAGFAAARGKYIVTLDADLQDVPDEIPGLIARLEEGYDLACGWRRKRMDPPGKVLSSRLYNAFVSVLTGTRVRDINCGLKGFRRVVAKELSLYGEWHRFIPLLARWKGFRVLEVPVVHRPRRTGHSKYGPERAPRGVLDLFTLLFLTRFHGRPAHFFGRLGLILCGGGGVILSMILYARLAYGTILYQYPLLILSSMMVVVGIQLIGTGLLAELIAYSFRREGGDYAVEETLD